jgi:CubicO group peptidase (beta-lactamase class C family)
MRCPRLLVPLSVACLSCGPQNAARAPEVELPRAAEGRSEAAPAVSAPSPDPASALASKIDAIFSSQSRPGVPGCAVGVYRAGQVLFARGYGLANLEHSLPITTGSVFDIASISKQFTAMAILLLEREGKLSLDDDVRKYIPEVPEYAHPIRLHQLLHHTAGVRDYVGLLGLAGLQNDWVTDEDLLFLFHKQKALNFDPGTDWQYSNTGYFLLSVIVRRVTGMKFSAFAQERIFEPLGMKDTRILDDHRAIVRGRATGYVPGKDAAGFKTAISRWEHPGASRVATTVDDLARWDANFYEPRVGDRAMIAELRTPGKLDNGKPLTYALGLFEETSRGRQVETHNGSTGGYWSDLTRYPKERLTVACLCNVEGDPKTAPWELGPAVADLFLPPLATVDAAASGGSDASSPKAPKYEPSSAELRDVMGAYYDPITFMVRTVANDHGQVVVGFQLEPGGPTKVYVPESPRTFVVRDGTTRLVFEPATRSLPARLVRTAGVAHPTTLVRFEPLKAPLALDEYVGRYVSEEIPRDLQIVAVDGKLRMATWGRSPDSEPFTAFARDVFKTEDGGIQFERDGRGRIRSFLVSGEGFHRIRFLRR